jgi:tetratricopeptide (TPR) repeat protein
VAIHSPDADVESGLTPLSAEFLNAAALFRPSCAARSAGAREGSFVVARRRGLPSSPEGLLLAFDAVGGGGEVAVAEEEEGDDELPPVASAPPVAEAAQSAGLELAEAGMAFRGGKLEAAGQHWERASELYAAGGDQGSRGDALRGLAQTQQAMGRYAESMETLRAALAIAERSGTKARIASALASLGNA